MSDILFYLENHLPELMVGTALVLIFYALARMAGARWFVAVAFAGLPLFMAKIYGVEAPKEYLLNLFS